MPSRLPRNLEPRWSYSKIEHGLSGGIGWDVARRIMARRNGHEIRLVRTRNYVGRQTALYADWFLFHEKEFADEFLRTFSRLQTPNRIETLEQDRRMLPKKTEGRLRTGGVDLGEVPAEQRWSVAHRYIEAHDKLRDLIEHAENLKVTERLL